MSLLLLLLASAASAAPIENFRLLDESGRLRELRGLASKRAVVIVAHSGGCPMLQRQTPELLRLKAEYEPKGVAFLMINADPGDASAEAARYSAEFGLGIPILLDPAGVAVPGLGLTRSSEALLIETAGWRKAYQGAIDGRVGHSGERPGRRHLRESIEAVLAGRAPEPARVDAQGCLFGRAAEPASAAGAPSYAREIAPILRDKCLSCHWSPSGYAPLHEHGSVRRWAPMLRETLRDRRMPPGAAGPGGEALSNDPGLSPEQLSLLLRWLESGAPRGDGDDPLPAAAAALARPPEAELLLRAPRPERVPAAGEQPYRYVLLSEGLAEDFWLAGLSLRHSDPRLVHHDTLYVFPPGAPLPPLGAAPEPGRAMIAPGSVPALTPWAADPSDDAAQLIPKGSRLVLEVHYRPIGRAAEDVPEAALRRSARASPRPLRMIAVENTGFSLPPGAAGVEVAASTTLARPIELRGLFVHMHARGASARVTARLPDGSARLLLSLPRYDAHRKHVYRLARPLRLPAGTAIVSEGVFDNSARNPENPDPGARVGVGFRTSDEMFFTALYHAGR